MEHVIQQFASQYCLTGNEVIAEIEKVFSSVLSQWYGLDTMVLFRKDLGMEDVMGSKPLGRS
ncbi:MAG TPA: hypothetical protein EYH19_09925 [Desulfocapsa sulfexigens]|nr:hypothetical protein [Desulfocapsa sulfexigens]